MKERKKERKRGAIRKSIDRKQNGIEKHLLGHISLFYLFYTLYIYMYNVYIVIHHHVIHEIYTYLFVCLCLCIFL